MQWYARTYIVTWSSQHFTTRRLDFAHHRPLPCNTYPATSEMYLCVIGLPWERNVVWCIFCVSVWTTRSRWRTPIRVWTWRDRTRRCFSSNVPWHDLRTKNLQPSRTIWTSTQALRRCSKRRTCRQSYVPLQRTWCSSAKRENFNHITSNTTSVTVSLTHITTHSRITIRITHWCRRML